MYPVMVRSLTYLSTGLLFVALLVGCRASRVLFPEIDDGDTNWLERESYHYFIYYRPGSPASQDIDKIAKTLDSCFEDVLSQLKVDFSDKISYYLYNSPDDLERWAERYRWGFFVGEFEYAVGVYDSIHKRINAHETVHVIAYHTVGIAKLIFLNEGLAEAVTHYHDRYSTGKLIIHKKCKSLLYRGTLFPIDVLADNDRFKGIYLSPEVYNYYNECGSFVRYLSDQYGLAKFKFLLPRADENNYKRIFQEIYGKSIEDFEKEWHEFLRNY
jgi:hypothetical protein